MNLHMIAEFFGSTIKGFATHYFYIFKALKEPWTKEELGSLFSCCGHDQLPEPAILHSLEGMLLSHEARVGDLRKSPEKMKE